MQSAYSNLATTTAKRVALAFVSFIVTAQFLLPAAGAFGTDTWVGNSSLNWSLAGNWTTTGGSTPPAAGDSLVFSVAGSAGTALNNDIAGLSVNNINLNGSGAFTFGGNALTLAGVLTDNAGANQTINLAIGGSGSLVKTDGSTLTLGTTNTFTGDTTIAGGTLVLSGSGNVSSSALTFGVPGSGNVGLSLNMTPSVAGTVQRSASLTFDAASVANAQQSGNFNYTVGGAGNFIENFGPLILAKGAMRNFWLAPNSGGNLRIVFDSLTRDQGAVFDFSRAGNMGTATIASQTANTYNIVFNTAPAMVGNGGAVGTPSVSVVPGFFGPGANAYPMTYDPANGLRSLNPSTEMTEMADGMTAGVNAKKTSASGTVTLTADTTINSLWGNSGTITFGTPTTVLNITSGTIGCGNGYAIGASAGDGIVNFGSAEGIVCVENSRTLTINSIIQGSGGLTMDSVRINNTGMRLVLGGANTFTGVTTIIGNGAGGITLNNPLALQNSTLDYNNYGGFLFFPNAGTYTLGGLKGSQNLDISGVTLTIGSAGDSDSTTYSGVLSGASGNLIKDGTGYLQMTSAATFTGDVTADAGRLAMVRSTGSYGAMTGNSGAVLGVTFNGMVTNTTVTLNAGSTNLFNMVNVSSTTNAPWTVSSGIAANGTSNLLNVVSGQFAVGGVYPLVNYNVSGGGSYSGTLQLGSLPVGVSGVLTNDTANGWIALVVTGLAPTVWSGAVNTNWDIATTANWTVGGSPATFLNGATVNFDDSASGPTTVNLTADVTVNGIVVSNTAKPYVITTTSGKGIGGTSGLTKSGNNSLSLANLDNTYTGPNQINAGAVIINGPSNFGAASASLSLANGTTLSDQGSFTSRRSITLGDAAGFGNTTLDVANGQSLTLSGVIEDGGYTNGLTKTGNGMLQLTPNNSFLGNVTVNGGVLVAGTGSGGRSELGSKTTTGRAITVNSAGTLTLNDNNVVAGAPADVTPALTINGGVLNVQRYNASGLSAYGNTLLLTNGATINVDDSADGAPYYAFQFGDLVTIGGTGGSVITAGPGAGSKMDLYSSGTTFDVASTGAAIDFAVGTPLMDEGYSGSANAASLIKSGAGSMFVSGACTYTGPTTVNAGRLVITRAAGTAGDITVADGADFGLVFEGPVTNNNVTLGSSSGCTFEMSGITSTHVAALNASSFAPNGSVTLKILAGSLVAGNQYPLIHYGGLGGNGFAAFTSLILPPGISGSLVNNTGNNSIDLLVGNVTPNKWTGTVNGNWDIATTANWTSPTTYSDGQPVLFDDSAMGTTLVNLLANVIPNSVVVSNIAKIYSISTTNGSAITGNAVLTKNGSGTLVLTNINNTYSGGTVVNAGTMVVDSASSLGASSGSLALNGTLNAIGSYTSARSITVGPSSGSGTGTFNIAAGRSVTLNGSIGNNGAGTGSLAKNGAGTLVLGAANTYNGATLVNAGTLAITDAQQQGGAYSVSDGAALKVTASAGTSIPMSSLTLGAAGATTLNVAGASTTTPAIRATNFTANGTVTINVLNGSYAAGNSLKLIKYSGSMGGSPTFVLGSLPLGISGSLSNDTANSTLVLNVTGATPLVWKGSAGSAWDIGATINWIFGANNVAYSDGSAVLFDDSSVNANVSLAAAVSPATVTISNSLQAYTITTASAAGSINGSASLTKVGSATLTLQNLTNTYSGGTTIGGGNVTIPVQADSTPDLYELGSGPVLITNNAVLQLNGHGGSSTVYPQYLTNDITLGNGRLFGSDGGQHFQGALTVLAGTTNGVVQSQVNKLVYIDGSVSGSGDLIIPAPGISSGSFGYGPVYFTASANSYSGTVTLNNGALGIQDPNGTALQNAIVKLNGFNAGVPNVTDTSGYVSPILWTSNTSFTVTLGGLAGTAPMNIDANLGVALILGNNRSDTAVYSGVLSGGAIAADTVTKIGSGIQWLIGTNTYSSDTYVNGGTLGISTFHAGNGNFTVASGAGLSVTNMGSGTSAMVSSLTLNSSTMKFYNVANTSTPLVTAGGSLTVNGGSTIMIADTNGLAAGNTYPLITASGGIGGGSGFSLVVPAGVTANLVTNGGNTLALSITSIAPPVNLNPTNIVVTVTGNQLVLSWPADHTGWYLQVQTNSLATGLETNWVTIPKTDLSDAYTNPVDPTNGTVFYRMYHP